MSEREVNSYNSSSDEIYRKIHFAVMAIESGARKLGISGKEMHDRLSRQGLIKNRLFKRYEELHTQSLDWVADDICETLIKSRPGCSVKCSNAWTPSSLPDSVSK